MKNKRFLKIMCIIIVNIIILLLCINDVQAFGIGALKGNMVGVEEVETMANKVIRIVSIIGSILSVIVIIVLGIKYMFGSIEERAEYKKSILPFLIGAVFVFAASTIASLIYNFAIYL